jgi:hypothetical protein
MTDQNTNRKILLIAGILAIGLLASVLTGSQVLNARAQTTSQEQKPVTSIDDIDCSKDFSSVHCVDGPGVEPDNGTIAASTNGSQVVTSVDELDCTQDPSLVHCIDSNKSTVSTSGMATTKVQPDKFTVTVEVETQGATAEETASRNANVTTMVIDALKTLGIAEEDMSTSNYSVYPVYATKMPSCVSPAPECEESLIIGGYKASNIVSITLDADSDIDAGEVIDAAIKAGANTVQGAYFFISQERQLEIQDGLIPDAIANARHRAEAAANAVNMQISGIQSINLNDVYFPIFAREISLQAADTQILPGEQEVTMTVTVVYFMSGGGTVVGEDTSGTDNAVAIAREFILSKLPMLGIEINNELDLHTDMVVELTESEFHVEFSVLDTNGQSHDGHIELENGEVTVAILDGKSIL